MKKILSVILMVAILIGVCISLTACDEISEPTGSYADRQNTKAVADSLSQSQPTPTDINFSLERFNLIRRAYWVNGQREKAASVICRVDRPLGYIVLFTESGSVVNRFVVDGKVSSLNSYLTADSDYYEIATGSSTTYRNNWLADVDGSYGENDSGIFFFTPDGKYIEWTGTYLYSDIPFEVDNPVVTWKES
jgi:hypothetical protein